MEKHTLIPDHYYPFYSPIWLSRSQLWATALTENQPSLLGVNHCALSYLIKRCLVVGLGPKAQPSTSVGFELGIFRSRVELVTYVEYVSAYSTLVNSNNYSQCIREIILKGIWKKDYQRFSKNVTLFL